MYIVHAVLDEAHCYRVGCALLVLQISVNNTFVFAPFNDKNAKGNCRFLFDLIKRSFRSSFNIHKLSQNDSKCLEIK